MFLICLNIIAILRAREWCLTADCDKNRQPCAQWANNNNICKGYQNSQTPNCGNIC